MKAIIQIFFMPGDIRSESNIFLIISAFPTIPTIIMINTLITILKNSPKSTHFFLQGAQVLKGLSSQSFVIYGGL